MIISRPNLAVCRRRRRCMHSVLDREDSTAIGQCLTVKPAKYTWMKVLLAGCVAVTLTVGCSANSNKPGLGNSPNAASCSDVLSLSNVAPAGGSKVWEQSLKEGGLKATVTYLLASKPNAKLALTQFFKSLNASGYCCGVSSFRKT